MSKKAPYGGVGEAIRYSGQVRIAISYRDAHKDYVCHLSVGGKRRGVEYVGAESWWNRQRAVDSAAAFDDAARAALSFAVDSGKIDAGEAETDRHELGAFAAASRAAEASMRQLRDAVPPFSRSSFGGFDALAAASVLVLFTERGDVIEKDGALRARGEKVGHPFRGKFRIHVEFSDRIPTGWMRIHLRVREAVTRAGAGDENDFLVGGLVDGIAELHLTVPLLLGVLAIGGECVWKRSLSSVATHRDSIVQLSDRRERRERAAGCDRRSKQRRGNCRGGICSSNRFLRLRALGDPGTKDVLVGDPEICGAPPRGCDVLRTQAQVDEHEVWRFCSRHVRSIHTLSSVSSGA